MRVCVYNGRVWENLNTNRIKHQQQHTTLWCVRKKCVFALYTLGKLTTGVDRIIRPHFRYNYFIRTWQFTWCSSYSVCIRRVSVRSVHTHTHTYIYSDSKSNDNDSDIFQMKWFNNSMDMIWISHEHKRPFTSILAASCALSVPNSEAIDTPHHPLTLIYNQY